MRTELLLYSKQIRNSTSEKICLFRVCGSCGVVKVNKVPVGPLDGAIFRKSLETAATPLILRST